MTLPLTKLCHKATVWHFGNTEKEAFQHLKDAFTMAPVLSYWAPDLPMTVETDASDQVIAAILSVTTPDTKIHPVTFPLNPYRAPNIITTHMIKNYWQSTRLTSTGDTTWKCLLTS